MDQEIQSRAIHEAGHAVVRYRLRLQTDQASIVPVSVQDSIKDKSEESWAGTKQEARDRIIALYAGFEAERIAYPPASPLGSRDDDERADCLLHYAGEATGELRTEASRLVRENWQVIQVVAEELRKSAILKGDEYSIIIDAFDAGEPWEDVLAALRA